VGRRGKGKFTDLVAKEMNRWSATRAANNAGHTLVVNGERLSHFVVPSGILYDHITR